MPSAVVVATGHDLVEWVASRATGSVACSLGLLGFWLGLVRRSDAGLLCLSFDVEVRRLWTAACGIPLRDVRGMSRNRRSFASRRTTKMLICRVFTGATGLEPATSGVTGRSWHFRAELCVRGEARWRLKSTTRLLLTIATRKPEKRCSSGRRSRRGAGRASSPTGRAGAAARGPVRQAAKPTAVTSALAAMPWIAAADSPLGRDRVIGADEVLRVVGRLHPPEPFVRR
jgi:hypothetical protein